MALLEEGHLIRGTWEVERKLGEGAFAEVYRVRHKYLGRQAMKVFKTVGMTVEEMEKLLSEAVILSQLQHPNIIRVFDANTIETSRGVCGFFTMEFVAGGSLDDFWRSHASSFVPVETAVDIARQILRGLSVAHGAKPPIVHRDIKPQNVLVGYDAEGIRVRVSDFGLAKQANPLTLRVSARGTRPFKAPEVFEDCQSDSCAGDVWAVGCTLYLLLTDRLPYTEPDDVDGSDPNRFDRPLIPPSRLNIQVDPFLDQMLFRALSIDSRKRYPSAVEMLADLERWKPQTTRATKRLSTPDHSKSALGTFSSNDSEEARKLVDKALSMAKEIGRLNEAADLLETALNTDPRLRDKYEYKLKLWRRGMVM